MPLSAPAFLQPALARPAAILGAGVSGRGVRALLSAIGAEGILYDEDRAKGAGFTAAAAREHALAIFSPGFPPGHPWLERARAAGCECLGELDFASLFWRGRLIAVTGTNGKTTLTELLAHALGAIGRDAHAAGNTGHPLSQLAAEKCGGAKESFAVCEVSSFQAETLQHFRADATLWTNFAEDHLERHLTLESYFAAKWKLVEHTPARDCTGERPEHPAEPPGHVRSQRTEPLAHARSQRTEPLAHARSYNAEHARSSDASGGGGTFLGSSVRRFAEKLGRAPGAATAVATEGQPADPRLAGTVFERDPQRENFLLAAAWWRASGFDEAALFAAARTFQPGRHRLARVAEHDGITYWNDSKATNFHAVEAALSSFSAPVVLIAGGKSKGGDFAGFVQRIAPRVKHAVLIGDAAAELACHCVTTRVAHSRCPTLPEAVRRATEVAMAGEHVLLSPAFASFDMFRNYEDRGDQFEALVRAMGQPGVTPAANLR